MREFVNNDIVSKHISNNSIHSKYCTYSDNITLSYTHSDAVVESHRLSGVHIVTDELDHMQCPHSALNEQHSTQLYQLIR